MTHTASAAFVLRSAMLCYFYVYQLTMLTGLPIK